MVEISAVRVNIVYDRVMRFLVDNIWIMIVLSFWRLVCTIELLIIIITTIIIFIILICEYLLLLL